MPPEDLAEVLTRLKADAKGGLGESAYGRDAREADVRARDRYRLALDTCDGLVLAYLRKRQKDGPLTATAFAKGLGGRSAGAVSNWLCA